MTLGKRIRGIALGAALSLAFYASGFLVLFTPLPFLYVWVTRGRRDGIMTLTAALAVVAAASVAAAMAVGAGAASGPATLSLPGVSLAPFFQPAFVGIAGAGYFAFFAVVALVLGEGVRRRCGLIALGASALAAGLGVLVAVIVSGMFLKSGETPGGFSGYLSRMVGEIIAMNQQSGDGSANIGFLQENADGIAAFMVGIAPAITFVFALLTVVVNMLLARRFIRGRHAFAHIHNVARFRLPDALVWAAIAAGIAFFADSYVFHSGALRMAAINILILLGALYFFQGMAVVVYFLQGVRAPLFKTMAYAAIIFFFQTIGMLIVAIGVADVWADFRLRSWRARHPHET